MTGTTRGGRYPAELHERAVRTVLDHQDDYPSQRRAIVTVAERLNIHPETLRTWVRRAEVDEGRRPGVTTVEKARIAGARA